jgi:hypothetical protein
MAELLGIGCTHYPPGLVPDEYRPWPLPFQLRNDPRIPARLKDPRNWPLPMQREWGDDEGLSAHAPHRARIHAAFRILRERIDAFAPDVVVIFGDDQYENFREECIPPFCVQAYEDLVCHPFHNLGNRPNIWNEPNDKIFRFPSHRTAAKYLTTRAIQAGIDMTYAYQPRSPDGIGHAFANTLLFLDLDRKGFHYPVVPISVNAYGRRVISYRGGILERSPESDPPSPSPARCFALGRAVARALQESPWRAVIIGSASWSHAFLCDKNSWIHPDHAADQALLSQLRASDYQSWAQLTTEWIDDCGEQEFLSWICLGGAMEEAHATAEVVDWLDTWVFNAAKCFALFQPNQSMSRIAESR